jgi:hypothetical protein
MKRGYRLRMAPLTRALRVAVFVVCGLILASGAVFGVEAWYWRLLSGIGAVSAVLAMRVVLGSIVVVTERDLVLQWTWPLRRRIPWYRVDHAEVMPGAWTILVELIDGERFELPCVEDIDGLYHDLEQRRKALDSA